MARIDAVIGAVFRRRSLNWPLVRIVSECELPALKRGMQGWGPIKTSAWLRPPSYAQQFLGLTASKKSFQSESRSTRL